jgi:DNA-binding NtrC family response regulator
MTKIILCARGLGMAGKYPLVGARKRGYVVLRITQITSLPEAPMDMGREVLIVEDEPNTRLLFSSIVQLYGFRPTLAADGLVALRELRSGKMFDVILLDLLLPRANGFEILRHIKCTNPDGLGRVIVVTAASSFTTQNCAELAEVWRFMRKPLEVEELALQIMSCSAEHARRSETKRTSSPEKQPLVPGNDATAR